jgi:hypothetical protein
MGNVSDLSFMGSLRSRPNAREKDIVEQSIIFADFQPNMEIGRRSLRGHVGQFHEAFTAGRHAARRRRAFVMWSVCAFMGLDAMIWEYVRHHYVTAALAPVFFLLVMPWLGRKWFKPVD